MTRIEVILSTEHMCAQVTKVINAYPLVHLLALTQRGATMTKVRVVIYLAADQVEALKRLQVKTGASVAELCRRAISTWLKRWNV
jgi:hypothetical protein